MEGEGESVVEVCRLMAIIVIGRDGAKGNGGILQCGANGDNS